MNKTIKIIIFIVIISILILTIIGLLKLKHSLINYNFQIMIYEDNSNTWIVIENKSKKTISDCYIVLQSKHYYSSDKIFNLHPNKNITIYYNNIFKENINLLIIDKNNNIIYKKMIKGE